MLRRLYMPVLACLGGGALVALLLAGVLALGSNRTLDEEVRAAETSRAAPARRPRPPLAPEYGRVLPALAGGPGRSLADFRGEVVLLNIWASWCPPCREEAPLIERAQRELAGHRGTVLGVSFRDAAADSRSFMGQLGLTYPDLRDVTGSFAEAYGTHALPESFLLDRRGRVRAISRGEIDAAFLAQAVALADRR